MFDSCKVHCLFVYPLLSFECCQCACSLYNPCNAKSLSFLAEGISRSKRTEKVVFGLERNSGCIGGKRRSKGRALQLAPTGVPLPLSSESCKKGYVHAKVTELIVKISSFGDSSLFQSTSGVRIQAKAVWSYWLGLLATVGQLLDSLSGKGILP